MTFDEFDEIFESHFLKFKNILDELENSKFAIFNSISKIELNENKDGLIITVKNMFQGTSPVSESKNFLVKNFDVEMKSFYDEGWKVELDNVDYLVADITNWFLKLGNKEFARSRLNDAEIKTWNFYFLCFEVFQDFLKLKIQEFSNS